MMILDVICSCIFYRVIYLVSIIICLCDLREYDLCKVMNLTVCELSTAITSSEKNKGDRSVEGKPQVQVELFPC